MTLVWAIGASFIVSIMSLAGVFYLFLKEKIINKILLPLVGFSAGALMGAAFLHLIPEATVEMPVLMLYLLIGFSTFFLIERFLHWHHCHKHNGKCDVHAFTSMNLIGDSVHNIIDGMIIGGSFLISIPAGIATTLAIISHEIPQEIGDYAVLVYGGFKKGKALLFNFLTGVIAIVGTIIGYVLAEASIVFFQFLIPFAAGGFIYIAASDLVPELHKDPDLKKSMASFVLFLFGIFFMYLVKIFSG